jgi:hypothetical protein
MAPKTIAVPAHLVDLAVLYLSEHAVILQQQKLEASSEMVRTLVAEIADIVSLQIPQTVEQQVAALTDIMGVGPTDESVGNKA